MDISRHKMRLILFLIQTLWKPGQSMLASALETMSLREPVKISECKRLR